MPLGLIRACPSLQDPYSASVNFKVFRQNTHTNSSSKNVKVSIDLGPIVAVGLRGPLQLTGGAHPFPFAALSFLGLL